VLTLRQDRIAVLAVQEPGEDVKAPLKRPAAASPERAPGAPRKYVIVENKEREPAPAPAPYVPALRSRDLPDAHGARTSASVAAAAAAAASFTLYDVVPAAQAAPPAATEQDAEIERFLPMLQEYLKVSDIALSPKLLPAQAPTGGETRIGAEAEDDYVWDVYYYRPSLTQWNALALGANVGSLCVPTFTWDAAAGADACGCRNGLPPSINDPNGSDSESEPEDEDDEDSNGARVGRVRGAADGAQRRATTRTTIRTRTRTVRAAGTSSTRTRTTTTFSRTRSPRRSTTGGDGARRCRVEPCIRRGVHHYASCIICASP
jgi:hypothetical protein